MRGPHRVIEPKPLAISSYVPTYGYAGFTLDFVGNQKLVSSGYEGQNICFSDTHSFQALGRLIDGPITSVDDLQAAEVALQSLVFFDQVVLLSPAIVAFEKEKGRIVRPPKPEPTPLGGDIVTGTVSDELLICEHVTTNGGNVDSSTLGGRSCLLGEAPAIAHSDYLSRTPVVAAAISMLPSDFRLPAFFSDPMYQQHFHDRGFTGKLYSAVNSSVLERSNLVPGTEVEVRLPLLTWCLLSRANGRGQVYSEIAGLRDEFAFARAELAELDQRMSDAQTQREREDIARYYQEAFEKVVAAARQSNFSYMRHVIYGVLEFATLTLGSKALKAINPNWQPMNPDTMVQRSIAARSFKEIADLKTVEAALRDIVTDAEMRTLETIARKSARASESNNKNG